ncbi:Transcriptional regulator MntR [compost metagenome]
MIGVQEQNIYRDVEGIEHHLSWDSITCIESLVEYFRRDEARLKALSDFQQELLKES